MRINGMLHCSNLVTNCHHLILFSSSKLEHKFFINSPQIMLHPHKPSPLPVAELIGKHRRHFSRPLQMLIKRMPLINRSAFQAVCEVFSFQYIPLIFVCIILSSPLPHPPMDFLSN